MARNSSGTYTMPAGANRPVVAGTTVNATAQNALEADLVAALTDSLSRTGNGGMQVPFKNNDGTLAAPGITFTNETGSGWYRVGANIIAWVIAGVERIRATVTGAKVTGTLEVTGATTLDTTLAVTQNGEFAIGLTTGGATPSITPGDIVVQRPGAPTTGTVALGNTGTHYLFYDGTNYQMPNAPLVNSAAFVVAGQVSSAGVMGPQTGSLTATSGRNGTGNYTVTVAGLTTGAVVTVSANGGLISSATTVTTGSFNVFTFSGAASDCAFAFIVAKL